MENVLDLVFQFIGADQALFLKPVNKLFYSAIHRSGYIISHIENYNTILADILKYKKNINSTASMHRHYIRFKEYQFIMCYFDRKAIMPILDIMTIVNNNKQPSITGLTFADYWKRLRGSYYIVQIQCSGLSGNKRDTDSWLDFAMNFITKKLLLYCFMEYYDNIQSLSAKAFEFQLLPAQYGNHMVRKECVPQVLDFISDAISAFDHRSPFIDSIYTKLSENNVIVHISGKQTGYGLQGNLFVSLHRRN